MVQGWEQRLVQEFVPQAAVEALDEGVLGQLGVVAERWLEA